MPVSRSPQSASGNLNSRFSSNLILPFLLTAFEENRQSDGHRTDRHRNTESLQCARRR
jgi:hypothetical protein